MGNRQSFAFYASAGRLTNQDMEALVLGRAAISKIAPEAAAWGKEHPRYKAYKIVGIAFVRDDDGEGESPDAPSGEGIDAFLSKLQEQTLMAVGK